MWQTLPPKDPYGGLHWLNVGFKAINFPKMTAREFASRKWEYVKIEYDPEVNMIRLTKSKQFDGHKVTKHQSINVILARTMPPGKYVCFEPGKDELLFNRC